jgi:hypothetical protein
MNRKQAILLIICVFWVMILPGCRTETPVKTPQGNIAQAQKLPQDLGADLERGVIKASGIGLPPKDASGEAQARLLARRAAITDGQRNLSRKLLMLEQRAGISRGSDDSAVVKNYTIAAEQQLPDGGYRVVLELRIDDNLLARLRSR